VNTKGLILLLLILAVLAVASPTHAQDVALWLARSCVGEAGFDSGATGECAAIAHVYAKRTKYTGLDLYRVIRRYSAAVKTCRLGWVCKLTRDLSRPENWPYRSDWKAYRAHWRNTLLMADHFVEGLVADPLPQADHYGGRMDHHRAVAAGWKMLQTPYKNRFYRVRRRKR
jgi:hypothetical protein